MKTVAANVQRLTEWNRSMAVALEKTENGSQVEDMFFIEKLEQTAKALGFLLSHRLWKEAERLKAMSKPTKFFIVNRRGERLGCFVRNDTVTANQLKFSKKSWIFFTTRGEAQATLDDIVAHCRQQHLAKKLRISEG